MVTCDVAVMKTSPNVQCFVSRILNLDPTLVLQFLTGINFCYMWTLTGFEELRYYRFHTFFTRGGFESRPR
jgi:hypothetical protein